LVYLGKGKDREDRRDGKRDPGVLGLVFFLHFILVPKLDADHGKETQSQVMPFSPSHSLAWGSFEGTQPGWREIGTSVLVAQHAEIP
jgi:hypothetical protein